MSRMSDIHAAASEIDTTDADAVQALADSIAAEHYAADVARYADTVARIIARRSSVSFGHARMIADEISTTRYADRVAIHADAVRRIIENLPGACRECGDSLPDYLPGAVKCDECADADGEPLECDECGIDDGARWDMPDGRAVCDGCADAVNGSTCPECECRPGARCDHGCHA